MATPIGQRTDGSYIYAPNPTPVPTPKYVGGRSTLSGQEIGGRSVAGGGGGGSWGGDVLGANTSKTSTGSGPTNTNTAPVDNTPRLWDQETQFIDDAFNSTMSYLNSAADKIRGQLPGIEKGINDQYGQSTNVLNQDYAQGGRQLDTAQQGGELRKEDAITSARRLYNELQTGAQQRFGGASSAGEAYQALAGRELQRNNQQINTDFSTFMGQIEQARTTIEEKYTLAKQNLEVEKNRMLSEARRSLDNQLMQIDQQKAMANEEKSNRKLQALQGMRNQIYQIQLATAQGSADIDKIKQGLETELAQYTQTQTQALTQAQGAQGQFMSQANTNQATSLAMNFRQDQAYQTPTGSIRKDENPMGQIFRPRNDFEQNSFA